MQLYRWCCKTET